VTALPAPDESWPEFDHWQAIFAAADVFPARWEGLHAAPPAHTAEATAYHLRKLVLLAEWVDMLARRSTLRLHYVRRGIKVMAVRQDPARPCPGCDPRDGRELGLDLDAMPPYHPGCRCVLVTVPAPPAGRRAHAPDRLRPRIG